MKTYKIRSLFYFGAFMLASLLYYSIEQQAAFEEQFQSEELVDAASEDFEETETVGEILP
ncbi:hypothetical protein [Allomuricauda sp. d1]|uniref:hypothetical protein n=1 Tax=Allomuricauda sp. d1 TaxID=3136725 RepID=UPI0031D6A9E0